MSTAPLPIDEFAKRLRTKYPGAYDSLSDAQLVQKVVNKYPDYKEHIASFAPTQFEQQHKDPGFLSAIYDKVASMVPSAEDALRTAGGSGVTAYQLATNPGPTVGRIAQETPGFGAAQEYLRSRGAGNSLGRSALNTAGTMVGVDPRQEEAGASRGNSSAVMADAIVPAVAAAASFAAPELADVASAYKPQIVGAADALQHPLQIPGKVAKAVLKKAIPDSPEVVAAGQRAAEETDAEGRNTAMQMQDAYNRRVAREQASTARQKAASDKAAAQEAAKPAPAFPSAYGPATPTDAQFQRSAQMSAAPPAEYPGAFLPSTDDFYSQRGSDISGAMRQQPDAFAPPAPAEYPGAHLPAVGDFYANRGTDISQAMRQQPNAFAPPAAPAPELGSPENPGFMSKLPSRLPSNLRGDPFAPTSPAASAPLGAIPSEEGVPGSLPKPSGRLVVLPQEAQALDQLQKIAKTRASQHGMQYAAGMRPAGGGRVPVSPTGINTTEFPGPRPRLDPFSPMSSEDLEQLVRQLQ